MADDVPVAPLAKTNHPVHGEVYLLANDRVEALVSPAAGAVVDLRILSSSNLLAGPLRMLPDLDPERVQAALPRLEDKVLSTWDARGWRNGDGSKVVMLTQHYGPPVSLRVTQIIRLDATGANLEWEARFAAHGTADTERIPWVEWNPALPAFMLWPVAGNPCGLESPGPNSYRVLTEQDDLLCLWEARWRVEAPGNGNQAEAPRWQGSTTHPDWRWLAPTREDLPPVGWTRVFHLSLRAQARQIGQYPCAQATAWAKDWPPSPIP